MESFLKQVRSNNLRVRERRWSVGEAVARKSGRSLGEVGKDGAGLYQALTVSDQAQMREFYLSKVEEVDAALRTKFQKLYQYY